ncbi:aminotransferase class V-fold PLP-dependent enzyme [Cellulophaga sp. E16_2]|uniref:aminotransferase class V-fold PLP-dependent enzyme n=1 Tax=Cellulophaga sp. E16_2 TaxID=2789297 RepID=UPI001A924118|nr:aminotransferase class V-fold PLP-dependent enzyme [Cellulophaga sp. E16_2]MBO0591890.1 aminotransferase class V-fold PLP-dependent enzyme [Cellulophaga sp. E16_2]
MQKIIKEFPILDQTIYANTAAYGIMYDGLLDWRQEHDLDYLIGGSDFKLKAAKLITQVRATVGAFFNCKNENVALVQNFSLGMNMLLEGLDNSNKVLLLDDDYPSLKWPFVSRGFDVHYVAILQGNLEEKIVEKIKSEKITILAISIVQWVNGIKIDLDFLAKLKAEFPELLIIADGTQFCGTEDFDFDNSAIDVLGASGYKWLLAGSGNGFMLFKEEIKNRFTLKTAGFNSANGVVDGFDAIKFVKHFEPGHLDTLSFGSLKCSLDFLSGIGMKVIGDANAALSAYAFQEFSKLEVLEATVLARDKHSTIFNIKGNQKMFDALLNNDIMCSQRGEGIRLSFHFYNTIKNVAKVINVIKKTK